MYTFICIGLWKYYLVRIFNAYAYINIAGHIYIPNIQYIVVKH